MANALIDQLSTFNESDWLAAIEQLLPDIHPVDREAVQIWFRFYPLALRQFLAAADDRDTTVQGLALQGKFELECCIDRSHHFLFGHRYWKAVKCSVEKEADEFKAGDTSLIEIIKSVGMRVAEKTKIERPLVNAISAVGLATLNQVGLDAFKAASGEIEKPSGVMTRSADVIVTERQKDDSQGLLGFLKTIDKKFSVAYAANDYAGKFPVMNEQELTQASARDTSKNWQELESRCWEGPLPVECTAASCGTCWVGVLGGADKLTEVNRRERRQMKVFGYNQPADEKPFLRLACQARATGNVTLVIPPWNGVFGKKVYGNIEELELEPNTTSAQALRDTIASATSNE